MIAAEQLRLIFTHEPPPCGVCAHRTYLLTCDDYDLLADEFDSRCAICRRAAHETGSGFLCVDHDAFIGQWAVRGLLCNGCNVRVDWATTPEDVAYLANPWYLRWLAGRGLDPTVQPEPPIGASVYIQGRRPYARQWKHTRKGWACTLNDAPGILSWERMNQRYGPHNLLSELPPRRF